MARCFCACHEFPGTYPPPCNVCGHHNDHGRYPGAVNMGWVPDGEDVGPLRIVSGAKWRQRAEDAEAKVSKLENLLARAYPWLHNPYRAADGSAFDFALAAEGDGIISDVEVAIQHLPDDKEH